MSDVVVITGASGGIGRATARRFAQDGAKIALLARGEAGLEAAAREVEELGGKALVLPTDVAYADQVEAAAQAAESELGPIDVWINNAMATIYAEFLDVEPYEYRRATDVTYHGMVWGTQAALKRMTASEPRNDRPGRLGARVPWHPAPGALLRREARLQGIHGVGDHRDQAPRLGHPPHDGPPRPAFNTTQFTWGRTKLPKQTQPVPPIYQPEIAADAIHWAAYHRRRQVYVGFPTVLNILGERMAPWFLDWYLAKTGYSSQMTKQPLHGGPGHDNLFEPVDGERIAARTGRSTTRRTRTASRRRSRSTGGSPARSRRSRRGGDGRRAAAEALASSGVGGDASSHPCAGWNAIRRTSRRRGGARPRSRNHALQPRADESRRVSERRETPRRPLARTCRG